MIIEPEMWQLNKMVIPKVKAHWEDVAYNSLHYDVLKVRSISKKHQNDPKKCCVELFEIWLCTSKEDNASTWKALLEQLKEVDELTAAVEQIRQNLIT